jgi:hypothetical protein
MKSSLNNTQVDDDLLGYFLSNKKDLMNHDHNFPEIYLTLIR